MFTATWITPTGEATLTFNAVTLTEAWNMASVHQSNEFGVRLVSVVMN
jgi:hypothetical protein